MKQLRGLLKSTPSVGSRPYAQDRASNKVHGFKVGGDQTPGAVNIFSIMYIVEARKLERHYPHALKVKYRES